MLTFSMPGYPPSPNRAVRRHFMANAGSRRTWRENACAAALLALRDAGNADDYPIARATVRVVWIQPDRRRRDPDNAIASCKAILDGCVDAGVLSDDSFAVIGELSITAEPGLVAGIRIEVRPLGLVFDDEGTLLEYGAVKGGTET